MKNQPIELLSDEEEEEEEEEEDVEYVVEKILKHRRKGRKNEYLIKWLNYPESESSWEPEENVEGCQELLKEYWDSLKNNEKKERAKSHQSQPKKKKIINIGSSSSSTDSDVVSIIEPKNIKNNENKTTFNNDEKIAESDHSSRPSNHSSESEVELIVKISADDAEDIQKQKTTDDSQSEESVTYSGHENKIRNSDQDNGVDSDILPSETNGKIWQEEISSKEQQNEFLKDNDIEEPLSKEQSYESGDEVNSGSSQEQDFEVKSINITNNHTDLSAKSDKCHKSRNRSNEEIIFDLPNPEQPAIVKDIRAYKNDFYFLVEQEGKEKWYEHEIVKTYLFDHLIQFYEEKLLLEHAN